MVQSLTYHRRLFYNTASNKTGLSQTSGNRILYLCTKKVEKAPKPPCSVCPGRPGGIHPVRPRVLMRLSETTKHISRACDSAMCVRQGQAGFLIEEQKIVVEVLKAQAQSQKAK